MHIPAPELLSVGIQYSMHDLICNVINYMCAHTVFERKIYPS